MTYGLYWIDPAEREKTLVDFRAGLKHGEPKSVVHDKYRVN
jgi:hypothetical protein